MLCCWYYYNFNRPGHSLADLQIRFQEQVEIQSSAYINERKQYSRNKSDGFMKNSTGSQMIRKGIERILNLKTLFDPIKNIQSRNSLHHVFNDKVYYKTLKSAQRLGNCFTPCMFPSIGWACVCDMSMSVTAISLHVSDKDRHADSLVWHCGEWPGVTTSRPWMWSTHLGWRELFCKQSDKGENVHP